VTTLTAPAERFEVSEPSSPSPPRRLGYQPALDGLRGLALVAIVVFHAQVEGLPGAFLSVSTFFTLSGFLIMSVVLTEQSSSGRIRIWSFYARRARRLLPAALVAVVLTVGLVMVIGDSTQMARLRPDALSALLYSGNWRLVLAGDSYGALFESPSAFTHFWTLGIEEQFYLAFPLAVVAIFWATRRSHMALALTFGALAVLSTGWSAHLFAGGAGIDRVYFGTDTRMAELLIGGVIAIWWARSSNFRFRHRRLVRAAGAVALAIMLILWHVAERTTSAFYQGGLAAYALLTSMVIVAAIQPIGSVRRVLGWRPLVYLGTISYGAYLLHWPILVWLQLRTPLSSWGRLVIGSVITLALATVLYRVVEHPIRTGRRLPRPSARRAAVPAIAAVTAVIIGATAWKSVEPTNIDFEAAAERINANARPAPQELSGLTAQQRELFDRWAAEQRAIEQSTAPRFAIFGDSTALLSGVGLTNWAMDNLDRLAPATGSAELGCGVLTSVVRIYGGIEIPQQPGCDGYLERWSAAADGDRIDIALVQFGPWDVHDHRLAAGGPALTIGKDSALDDALREQLDLAVTTLMSRVGYVILLSSPNVTFDRVDGRDPPRADPTSDPSRMERFRQIEREVAGRHPGRVGVVDLASYINSSPDETRLRPDGIHLSEATATEVAAWLGPRILDAYERADEAVRASDDAGDREGRAA